MKAKASEALRGWTVRHLKPKFSVPFALMSHPRLILDVGVANDSYRECKAIYPTAVYHGLDVVDRRLAMAVGDHFYLRDLDEPGALTALDPSYDLIIVNHVLEHLDQGTDVFRDLCALLAVGGVLYAEFPSLRTAYRRKTGGRYHFHDDPTHRRFYGLEELANCAIRQQCEIISCGPVSTPLKDALALPRALAGMLSGQGWGPYLLHFQRKIDHIFVRRCR